ncbi:hypothetical protein A3H90_00375 [Candidatus Peribacteria bacterium RIFCSPLOWO2_02_FULL_55_36]|nr:MAG: hypothetical protein A3H90_00375 [Candidatus Peribacteria bacterium RIFCSPLOWO2_02_FULL_55_36]
MPPFCYALLVRRLFVLLLLSIIAGGFLWYRHALGPVDSMSTAERPVKISDGMSVGGIADLLEEKGIVRSSTAFHLFVRLRGVSKNLQAGNFVLSPGMSAAEVVWILRTGKAREIAVTIPEGFTIKDIDALLAGKDLMEPGAMLDCARRCDFSSFEFLPPPKGLAPRGGRLEGYLFPDTYYAEPANFVPKFFLERMLGEFRKKVAEGLKDDFRKSERSLHEVVTMASLIEEEAKTDEERPVIAGILWKRFDASTGLGVDAAVRYILEKPAGTLTAEDLATHSSYNLRRFRGLPPGPIANPGVASIRAALRPQPSDYWYYLHGKDGKVHYAVTNDEHNANKARYLR